MPTTWTRTTVRPSGGPRPSAASVPLADNRGGARLHLAGDAGERRRRAAAEELDAPAAHVPDRQLDALRARVAMLRAEADVRRGIEGALRRGGADATIGASSRGRSRSSASGCPGGIAARAVRGVPQPVRDPARAARRDIQGGDRRLPQPHARSTSRCRRARASPSSTSRTRAGAATTGIRASTRA